MTRARTGRAVVYAERGMVATASPLATQTGVRVLREGGNAIDAALAAATVTWATMPMMAGPGGDAFLLVHHGSQGGPTAINGAGPVGQRATVEFMRSHGYTSMMPLDGAMSAAIPGAVDAFDVAARRFGSWGWDAILHDAIVYAEAHPISPSIAGYFASAERRLRRFPTTDRTYFGRGRGPEVGEILRQPDLAKSLRRIAVGGRDEFYRGSLAQRLGSHQAAHGLFDEAELGAMKAEVYEPISVEYRGLKVHQLRPPSQGIIHLEEMSILSNFDLRDLEYAEAQHVMIESKKIAFADRNRYLGDPRYIEAPVRRLISPKYGAERARMIEMDRVLSLDFGSEARGDTTYLCTADRDGNSVSLVQSLSMRFGTGELVGDTGLFLNNRAGRGFMLDADHPNCIAPGKRTMSTLNCYSVTRDGHPYLVGGTPGGDGQPQWNMQTLVGVVDFELNIQQAVEAPRWSHDPSTDPANLATAPTVQAESRFGRKLLDDLRSRGHRVRVVGPWAGGGNVQLILVDSARGILQGASDPRGDGYAAGY